MNVKSAAGAEPRIASAVAKVARERKMARIFVGFMERQEEVVEMGPPAAPRRGAVLVAKPPAAIRESFHPLLIVKIRSMPQ